MIPWEISLAFQTETSPALLIPKISSAPLAPAQLEISTPPPPAFTTVNRETSVSIAWRAPMPPFPRSTRVGATMSAPDPCPPTIVALESICTRPVATIAPLIVTAPLLIERPASVLPRIVLPRIRASVVRPDKPPRVTSSESLPKAIVRSPEKPLTSNTLLPAPPVSTA